MKVDFSQLKLKDIQAIESDLKPVIGEAIKAVLPGLGGDIVDAMANGIEGVVEKKLNADLVAAGAS